jgi:hypothetical protein
VALHLFFLEFSSRNRCPWMCPPRPGHTQAQLTSRIPRCLRLDGVSWNLVNHPLPSRTQMKGKGELLLRCLPSCPSPLTLLILSLLPSLALAPSPPSASFYPFLSLSLSLYHTHTHTHLLAHCTHSETLARLLARSLSLSLTHTHTHTQIHTHSYTSNRSGGEVR